MGQIHNELRYALELVQQYEKYFALEKDAGVERLGETLTPVLDMWRLPEWAALRREALWWIATSQGAVAAQNSFVAVVNLAGSGVIVTVDGWATDVLGAQVGSLPQATAIAGGTSAADGRDRRYGSSLSVPQVRRAAGSGAVLNATDSWDRVLANVLYPIPVVLTPGNNLSIVNATVNAAVFGSFFGRVRRARDAELSMPGSL